MKKTCLYDRHVALGAQMSPFAGWDMPIEYTGIIAEHNAVRTDCGVFDVSHMGEVKITGPDAQRFVNHIFTNDITSAPQGKVYYGMMLHPHGGVVDDLLVYCGKDQYLLVINASNIDKDIAWINAAAQDFDVTVTDLSPDTAELAVQGPKAEQVLQTVLNLNCSDLAFYTFKETTLPTGETLTVSRTGYTGEDGFEIYAPAPVIQQMWDTLIDSRQATPCGLGCRDTLRFEVGLPLYGDELADDITPLEAGLSMFVKPDKPHGFIGSDAIARQKAEGTPRKLIGLEINDRAIARHGHEVLSPQGEIIGHITTGYRGISVDKSIASALVLTPYATMGTQLQVKIRRKTFPATVVSRKFFKKSYKKQNKH